MDKAAAHALALGAVRRWSWLLLGASLTIGYPSALRAAPPATATEAAPAAAAGPVSPPEAVQGPQPPTPRLLECAPGTTPCVRPRAARLTLGLSGFAFAAVGTGLLLFVGDRLRAGDPGAMLMGMGALGIAGVSTGAIAAAVAGDFPNSPDRIRPATLGLRSAFSGTNTLGERAPGSMAFNLAPTWYFPDGGGRLRFLGAAHGELGPRIDVDPRAEAGQPFPVGLEQRGWGVDLGADLAISLPYGQHHADHPRRPKLGGWELRWRPTAHIRRDTTVGRGEFQTRQFERVMVLPLTVGARWKIAPRQRFTAYVGPRFDFLAYALGDGGFERGGMQPGPVYGEAWYDIDFPHLLRGPARERYTLQGQLSMGYIHSRFDGDGTNVGGAKGFIGPIEAAWRMKLRRHGKATAWQFGAGGRLGNGFAAFLELGVTLPDLGRDPSFARSRRTHQGGTP